jgi:hypothetical protein
MMTKAVDIFSSHSDFFSPHPSFPSPLPAPHPSLIPHPFFPQVSPSLPSSILFIFLLFFLSLAYLPPSTSMRNSFFVQHNTLILRVLGPFFFAIYGRTEEKEECVG